MMSKLRCFSLMLLIGSAFAYANNFKGIVHDEDGNPLPYSTVRIKKRRVATLSDSGGIFDLNLTKAHSKDTAEVSYMGYQTANFPLDQIKADSVYCINLKPMPTILNEIIVNRSKKFKVKKQGKKRSSGMFKCFLNGESAGDTFGYEVRAKTGRRMLLYKVGFFFAEGPNQMQHMKFRINIYDMNGVKKGPTNKFIGILPKPIYFDFNLGEQKSGKFVYTLPNYVLLPQNAVVEIELLENLNENMFYFKANILGKKTWSRTLKDNEWDQNPFSTPFFIECIEEQIPE